ncbi:Protein-glutamate methylesterase/protein-glutamine glutaminase [Streptomyces alboniger]
MAIRVLLVDQPPLLRTGFRMILEAEQDIAVVGEAGDGLQALDQVRALQPDVVLMDIRMPRMDGVEATGQITGPGRDGPAKVLVLTTFDLDEYVVEALRAGASGFLLKDATANELVQAIRVVAAARRCSRRASRAACSTSTPRTCPPATSRCPRPCTPSPSARWRC